AIHITENPCRACELMEAGFELQELLVGSFWARESLEQLGAPHGPRHCTPHLSGPLPSLTFTLMCLILVRPQLGTHDSCFSNFRGRGYGCRCLFCVTTIVPQPPSARQRDHQEPGPEPRLRSTHFAQIEKQGLHGAIGKPSVCGCD